MFDMNKKCSRCKATKGEEDFWRNKAMRDGRQSTCKPCSNDVRREYEQRNAEVLALRRAERLARRPIDGVVKECRKCGDVKPLLQFYAHRSTADRRANYCMDCQRATTRAWQAANAEKVREYNARQTQESGAKQRDHRQWWLRLYKLTQDDYGRLLEAQGGVCAVCLQPERYIDSRTGNTRRLAVDHDHATGQVRGLLCGRCNRSIGQFGDCADTLARAAVYLRQAVTA